MHYRLWFEECHGVFPVCDIRDESMFAGKVYVPTCGAKNRSVTETRAAAVALTTVLEFFQV